MKLFNKLKTSIGSVVAVAMINACSNACSGVQIKKEDYLNNTAIMITGRDSNTRAHNAFKNSNEILTEYFQRTFKIRDYEAESMPEQQLYDMIQEASEGRKIIISYAGHGSLTGFEMADGRTIDAMFFPIYSVRGEIVVDERRNRREDLRINLRTINNTSAGELTDEDRLRLTEDLYELGLPPTPQNLEYIQFYDPTDNRIFPQEILLQLKNFHGDVAFITNACFAGQLNDLIENDPEINALALASSPYNELSKFDINTGLLNTGGGFYLSQALAAKFNSYRANRRINLAAINIASIDFIRRARVVSRISLKNGYNIRDEGFNFQRFSRLNEFTF